jgi:hypothetical protein
MIGCVNCANCAVIAPTARGELQKKRNKNGARIIAPPIFPLGGGEILSLTPNRRDETPIPRPLRRHCAERKTITGAPLP